MRQRIHTLIAAALLIALAAGLALTTVKQPALLQAQPPEARKPQADLALIPTEALGFVHVRAAEVWKSDAMKDMRMLINKAGPKAFATLDADFHPAPSTIDRVTLVMLPFKEKEDPALRMVAIMSFAAPFDAAKIRKMYMPKAEEKKAGGKSYYNDASQDMAIHFASDQHLVVSNSDVISDFLSMPVKADGPLQSAITLAATRAMTVCVNIKGLPIPPKANDEIPPDLRPLLRAERLLITADVGKEVAFNMQLGLKNDDDAKEVEASIKKAAAMGRDALKQAHAEATRMLEGKKPRGDTPRPLEQLPEAVGGLVALAGINTLDEILADLPIKRDGANITASVTLPSWATPYVGTAIVSAGLMIPAVQRLRSAASRTQAMNNLRQISFAMHNYHETKGTFPPAAICDKNGKKLLSWRVAILPYIEQENLYKQFKLDEPWDSEHNKKASATVVKTYMDPRSPDKSGKTIYRVFVGKNTAFDWQKGKKATDFTDGLSNSILVVAAGDPVEWAKPDDFEFDPDKPLPDLTKPFPDLLMALADGSVRTVSTTGKNFEQVMKQMIVINDGQVPIDFDDR